MDTYINPYRPFALRAGMATWLKQGQFTHAITLNPNRGAMHPGRLEALFKAFCMEMDRLKLGRRRVHQVLSPERFHAIAMPEKLDVNAHLHLSADLRFAVERAMADEEIELVITRVWTRLTRGSGSTCVKSIRDAGWGWYSSKEMPRLGHDYFMAATYHAA